MLFLTVHFTAVLVYADPTPANEGSKLKAFSYPYVYPYFHQSWSMFVPIPKQNFNIYIRDEEHGWEDIFGQTLNEHQCNRLGGNENLLLSLVAGVHYYASSVGATNFIATDDGSNPYLKVLEKVLTGYMTSKYGKRPVKMETIIRIHDLSSHKIYAHYYKN